MAITYPMLSDAHGHCGFAGWSARPQVCRTVVLSSAQFEGRDVEQRTLRAELQLADVCARMLAQEMIDQQGCGVGPVHHEAGITFHVPAVFAIVVDAMAVEGERR